MTKFRIKKDNKFGYYYLQKKTLCFWFDYNMKNTGNSFLHDNGIVALNMTKQYLTMELGSSRGYLNVKGSGWELVE